MVRRSASSAIAAGKPEKIAQILETEIRSGRLAHGDQLQSENELVRRFAVSRSTVRKSLSELTRRGLITTSVGIGSFVTFDGNVVADEAGWTKALEKAGANALTRTLRLEIVEDRALAEKLGLESAEFIALDRARTSADDGHAISIEHSRIPMMPEIENLPVKGLRDGSLHATLREAGLHPDHGEEWIDVVALGADDAEILSCQPGAMFLRTRRVIRTREGRVMEHITSLLNPTHFALHREF
ncbi:GntR family transcriptional regulator [Jiella mangrovi]|uniref:GntR family transcriptional regulator n=1 Tax=Jiella mangrovi TaxID=2821407 RepID=A0ABS4BIA2_9HYPH|nr:GntR family transcriptional regulator [Jiella mangrovi]MBP0616481.1 GntR family transcriptional regulator [Jiella mangrovi]